MGHKHTDRRFFLKMSARLAALGLAGVGVRRTEGFLVRDLQAATATDYKALVCIFQFGGNDSNNMIVPVDGTRYPAYQSVRGALALTPAQLAPAIPDINGNPYALHASMAPINPIYMSGRVAFVLNCGMLKRPLTRAQYRAGGGVAPPNLFSHSDQTEQTQAGATGTMYSGWGGRLLDMFGESDSLASVSVSSPSLFLQGDDVRPNVVSPGSSLALNGLDISPASAADARRQAVNALLLQSNGNPVREAANRALADGLQLADSLRAGGTLPPLAAPFPNTGIANQLKQVALLIKLRSQMGPGRQVFFCSTSGFDTHSGQVTTQNTLLLQLAQALAAFYSATLELGVASSVTAFTQTEFSRTMQNNGDGTDHAWGGHNMVLGGAVRGGIYGQMPNFTLGGPDDANNRGVWIPTISSAQFGATLGRWFGATPAQLLTAFPNLVNFPNADIGFMG
jgi:uncharacterized protein (DUF1501 family)